MSTATPTSDTSAANIIPGDQVEALLIDLAGWGHVTTILFAHGSIFEFKGPFPKGESHSGFYNLEGDTPGLHGHLNLNTIDHVSFQDTPRRGRPAYALVFNTAANEIVFKVFLGRDEQGEILPTQLERFLKLQQQYQ